MHELQVYLQVLQGLCLYFFGAVQFLRKSCWAYDRSCLLTICLCVYAYIYIHMIPLDALCPSGRSPHVGPEVLKLRIWQSATRILARRATGYGEQHSLKNTNNDEHSNILRVQMPTTISILRPLATSRNGNNNSLYSCQFVVQSRPVAGMIMATMCA